ncbi:hypothetical protein [Desulfosarcina cetonica]|uniref:hypothetical protein n=1 Tax=Desulfosarcina cetonica TaxID=90730 RepID=UPI001FF02934|nr:hypothetical protein [Desulfosarcina cetonica]
MGKRGQMTEDRIYHTPQHPVPPFEFNAAVVNVFEDMIHRSVPMYAEIIRQQARMIQLGYHPGTRIYDLGCSTGNLALALCAGMPAGSFEMVAVDSSKPMLDALPDDSPAGRTAAKSSCDTAISATSKWQMPRWWRSTLPCNSFHRRTAISLFSKSTTPWSPAECCSFLKKPPTPILVCGSANRFLLPLQTRERL